MSNTTRTRYKITVVETQPDGTSTTRIEGTCDAFIIAITAKPHGELRVLTDHDGPINHRRTAFKSLTTHIRSTIGLGR
ncbi:MAG: hypothetical protein M3083_23965 [Actinomycetota bacterium]|nr:hypothetical protein [Actinomycetota bacterium]MDQ6948852.1 hypothetical protein [Actinomycetota bacterium]